MRSIASEIEFAASLGSPPSDKYIKAFRMMNFGRCPKCDSPSLISWTDFDGKTIKCNHCAAKIVVMNYEISRAYEDFYMSDAFAMLVVDKFTEEK